MLQGALTVYTAPASEPVSATEAKNHLRITGTDEDALITGLIQSAREYCENFTRRAFISQTLDLRLDSFPGTCGSIILPRPPAASVTSIIYTDTAGTLTTLAASQYTADIYNEPGRIVPAYSVTWPTARTVPNAVTVRYVAGWANAAAVPQEIKQAMLLLIGHWHENREAINVGNIVTPLTMAVESLLWSRRVQGVY